MISFFNYSFEHPWFFTNYSFLLVLGIFLMIFSLFKTDSKWREIYVILFSLFFYYKSSGPFLLIFITMIIADYQIAKAIESFVDDKTRKFLLIISILFSLSFLIYFKYSAFFLGTMNDVFNLEFKVEKLFLPIGISFYTFQSISYIVDVYHRKINSSRNFIDYAFYMTFFPHLVAGPIVRARDFIPQIGSPLNVDSFIMKSALFRILSGLAKKVLIADYIARYVDMVHLNPSAYSGIENLLAVYGYAFQIYFDFSGYSDIAIGIALLMGYELKENFNNPYRANSITEFWRRWHISLSSWLRDYIYIPLGGNKHGLLKTYLFLMITMTIGGLWHGASWSFVVWGVGHGLALVFHKLVFNKNTLENNKSKLKSILGVFFTFHFVALMWVFFRAMDFKYAFTMLNQIVFKTNVYDLIGFVVDRTALFFMLVVALLIIFIPSYVKTTLRKHFINSPLLLIALIVVLFFQIVLQLKTSEIAPFIYFQF
jgi:alginate O-acetyltransferase complex protein AlgI